jgi:hypothetical protein
VVKPLDVHWTQPNLRIRWHPGSYPNGCSRAASVISFISVDWVGWYHQEAFHRGGSSGSGNVDTLFGIEFVKFSGMFQYGRTNT